MVTKQQQCCPLLHTCISIVARPCFHASNSVMQKNIYYLDRDVTLIVQFPLLVPTPMRYSTHVNRWVRVSPCTSLRKVVWKIDREPETVLSLLVVFPRDKLHLVAIRKLYAPSGWDENNLM